MKRIAAIHVRQGSVEKALGIYLQLAEDARKKYGEKSPGVVEPFITVAVTYRRLKQLDLALPWEEASVDAVRASRGLMHHYTLDADMRLARSYAELGQTEKAGALRADVEKRLQAKKAADAAVSGGTER